jgi:hypothetical protein
MVRKATEPLDVIQDQSVKNCEGFAYVSNRKPRHSNSKKPKNGDLDARCMAKLFLEYLFPVFEFNSKVSQYFLVAPNFFQQLTMTVICYVVWV